MVGAGRQALSARLPGRANPFAWGKVKGGAGCLLPPLPKPLQWRGSRERVPPERFVWMPRSSLNQPGLQFVQALPERRRRREGEDSGLRCLLGDRQDAVRCEPRLRIASRPHLDRGAQLQVEQDVEVVRVAHAAELRERLGGPGQDALKRDEPLPEAGRSRRACQSCPPRAESAATWFSPRSRPPWRPAIEQAGMATGQRLASRTIFWAASSIFSCRTSGLISVQTSSI